MKETVSCNIGISGMSCEQCRIKIEKALRSADGIIHADVSYNKNSADIEYDSGTIKYAEILKIINDLGYEAGGRRKDEEFIKTLLFIISAAFIFMLLDLTGLLNAGCERASLRTRRRTANPGDGKRF